MSGNGTALVTGGHGFLGSWIVSELRQRDWRVAAPTHAELDLMDHAKVEKVLALEPDLVVHAAATVGGIGANTAEPGRFLYDNAVMGLQLMDAARRHGVGKFVTIGTACMYPEHVAIPMREEDLWDGYPAPETAPYGIAKRLLLAQTQAYREQYGFNGIFLIPTNLYGPGDNFDPETGHVIPALIRRLSDPAPGSAVLWGTGRATRDFLYVADAARGIVDAAERYDSSEPVNLGSGTETSIAELAELIADEVGSVHEIRWDGTHPDGTPRRLLDTKRAEGFGFSAEMGLADGLMWTVEWWRTQR